MPIPVSDVVDRVGFLLLDETHVRWTETELIAWINEAAGAIMTRRPAAFARRSVISLVAGTAQNIPADGAVLLDVVRNIADNGTTPGQVIRRTDRQALDDADPSWHTAKQKAVIKHYTFDDRAPKQFYVYPPAIAGTKVELMDAAMPAEVAATTDSLDIGAEYLEPVVNYVAYRANCKDSEFANGAVAAAYYQAFEAALGIKSQSQQANSPNQPTNSV